MAKFFTIPKILKKQTVFLVTNLQNCHKLFDVYQNMNSKKKSCNSNKENLK